MTPEQAATWARFKHETGTMAEPYDVFAFGDTPALANDLLGLVLAGTKQATATRLAFYQKAGMRPPRGGDLSLVLDGMGLPSCIIETTVVDIAPFNTATEDFAYIEGEGDKSLGYWHRAHLAYYQRECACEGNRFSEDEDIVFEQFRLIWTPERQ